MTYKKLVIFTLMSLLILLTTTIAVAQIGGSYDLSWSTIDNGGGFINGGTYEMYTVIGQPDAGNLTSSTYAIDGGFLYPDISCGVLTAPTVMPSVAGNDVLLSWGAVSGATLYTIYRDTVPYAPLGTPYISVASPDITYTDMGAGIDLTNHYYHITSNTSACASDISAEVGAFKFAMTPGS